MLLQITQYNLSMESIKNMANNEIIISSNSIKKGKRFTDEAFKPELIPPLNTNYLLF